MNLKTEKQQPLENRSLVERWWQFICERFPLSSHIPMVACFTIGNAFFSIKYTGASLDLMRLSLAFFTTLLFFFRLRCFDEIKDYQIDLAVNPSRPLARGLLSISSTKKMIVGAALLEMLLVSSLGLSALAVHSLAMGYSLLMYKEFFIGRYLRPHLTTYAVTHTFVSTLIGASIATQITGVAPWDAPWILWLLGPINWLLFNLFEFARKTFAPEEEREHVESYSSLFGPLGAGCLSLTQIGLVLLTLAALPSNTVKFGKITVTPLLWYELLALPPIAATIYYIWRRSPKAARIFRNTISVYLLAFYLLLTWQSWV